MAPVARYTALRLLVFFGVMCAAWLCGLRSYLLFVVAALLSTFISYFALNRFREETVEVVQHKVEERQSRVERMAAEEDDE